MKIFDYDARIFDGRGKELDELVTELKKITMNTAQFDDGIFTAHEKVRFCEVVKATGIELAETRGELYRAQQKKLSFKTQAGNRRNELFREAETITRGWVEYFNTCVDGSLFNIKNQIHFEYGWSERPWLSEVSMVQTETNLSTIQEARKMLLVFRTKIREMVHSTSAEIRSMVEVFDEKINSLNFGKYETIIMTLQEAKQFEADLNPSPPNIPREIYELAQRGLLADKWDDTLQRFEQAKKNVQAIIFSHLPSSKG